MAKNISVKFSKGLLNIRKRTKKGIQKGVLIAADIIAKEMRKTRLFQDRTGILRKSLLPVGKLTGEFETRVQSLDPTFRANKDNPGGINYSGFVDDKVGYTQETLDKTQDVAEKAINEAIRRELSK
jgi:hypothetical protein